MKKLLLTFTLLCAFTANAQNGVTNPYRFGQGEDSIRCIREISIMNTNVKNKDTRWPMTLGRFSLTNSLLHV